MLKDSTHLYFEHKTIPEDDATSYDIEERTPRDTLLPTQQVMTSVKSIQLAKLVICGAPLWLNQPDSLTSKSCFGRAFLHLQISSTVKLEEGSKDWMHRFSNLNTDSSHLVKHLQHDDTASCRHQNPSTISKTSNFLEIRIRNRLTSSTLKRKHSLRTQFFLIKRPSQSSLDCSKPSTTTTTPKSDSSSNHPEPHQLLHRSPHDNRSLCDDRLHHQLHLLNLTVNDIILSTSPSSLITISRSQSRITSSTLSTWKNTYSNLNMVTLDQHDDRHHQHDDSQSR